MGGGGQGWFRKLEGITSSSLGTGGEHVIQPGDWREHVIQSGNWRVARGTGNSLMQTAKPELGFRSGPSFDQILY